MTGAPRILIVDDERYMAESLRVLLGSEGYRIACAGSGCRAMRLIDKEPFDLILLDVSLPDMNGQAVMDFVKSRAPETIVIFFTGHATVDSAVKALKSGAYDYLRKPFEYEELSQTVKNALEQKRLVAEKDRINAQLTVSENRYQFLIQNSPDIIYILDENGCFTFINEAVERLLGYTPGEIVGKPYSELVHEADAGKAEWFFNERRTGERANAGIEIRLKTKKDPDSFRHYEIRHITVELKASGLYDRPVEAEDKRFLGTHGVARDITDRKRLEAQVLKDERMKAIGTLAGGIAHDFNNLLMGIQGRTSLMLSGLGAGFPYVDHLRGIEEYVASAAELTQRLLGFARGGKYEVKPADINEIIKKSLDMFSRTQKEVTIQTRFRENVLPVEVDSGQMEQVFLNLYLNAWQSMTDGGCITLETENVDLDSRFLAAYGLSPGKFVRISVADTGTGMDKATQAQIFEPFFTTKEIGRGTGLGLASVHGIIKNHGGVIAVDSIEGRGTTFDIYLPASGKVIQRENMKPGTVCRGSGTILLIDDEKMILDVGKDMLEVLGYRVYTAEEGGNALSFFQKHSDTIDLVILDMIMPGMDGSEVYDRLKGIEPGISVLLSSGYSIDGKATEILNKGCQGFIQKPFNLEKLSQRIRDVLNIVV